MAGRYKPYPEYLKSDNYWFDGLPANWKIVKLKQVVDQNRQITYGIVQAGPNIEGGIPYIRPADMTDEHGIKDYEGLLRTSESVAAAYERSKVRVGDIICSIGPSFGKLMIAPDLLDGANLTQGTARVAISSEQCARYFFWALRSPSSFNQWESSVGGATFRALNLGPLADTYLALPSKDEQEYIANFLDHETAKIDTLIEKQQHLIQLLKEKRQAVISHAVTKGLSSLNGGPNAKLRDSGVEWLGEVPEGWNVCRLKQVIKSGSSISYGIVQPGEPLDEGVPFIQTTNMSSGAFDINDLQKTTQEIANTFPRSRLEGGEVILGIRASIGAAYVVPNELKGVNLSRGVARILPGSNILSEYLVMFFGSGAVERYWGLSKQGSTFSEVSIETVKELWLAIPSLSEQEKICSYVRLKSNKLNKIIDSAIRQYFLLSERRTALISAAVTGKIDVRDWTAPQASPANKEVAA